MAFKIDACHCVSRRIIEFVNTESDKNIVVDQLMKFGYCDFEVVEIENNDNYGISELLRKSLNE